MSNFCCFIQGQVLNDFGGTPLPKLPLSALSPEGGGGGGVLCVQLGTCASYLLLKMSVETNETLS